MTRALASLLLAGCAPVAATVVNDATAPRADAACLAALTHVEQCDARFAGRRVLCSYGADGHCSPYLNVEQTRCLQAIACERVREAIDRGDWICGAATTRP